jgi:hypothetical protein
VARFDRFKKLERARPDGGDEPQAQSSLRFGKIEARKHVPAAAPDPFAPPPEELEAPLEVEEGDDRLVAMHKQEKRVKAQAVIDAERQRIAEIRMREEAQEGPLDLVLKKRGVLLNLTNADRVYVGLGGLVVIGALAAIIGPFMWGLAPIVIAVVLASIAGRRGDQP